ncbi:hypothetical protein BH20BAC1_BH20BAC1_20630 [soil metagenome]
MLSTKTIVSQYLGKVHLIKRFHSRMISYFAIVMSPLMPSVCIAPSPTIATAILSGLGAK